MAADVTARRQPPLDVSILYSCPNPHDGYAALLQNMKCGMLAAKELLEFFREAARVQEECVRSHSKLEKLLGSHSTLGTLGPVVHVCQNFNERFVALHKMCHTKLTDLVKGIVKFVETQHKMHKKVQREEEADTVDCLRNMHDLTTHLNRLKARQVAASTADKAAPASTEVTVTDLLGDATLNPPPPVASGGSGGASCTSEQVANIAAATSKVEAMRPRYESVVRASANRFRDVEIFHVTHIRQFLEAYSLIVDECLNQSSKVHAEFQVNIADWTVPHLMDTFVVSKMQELGISSTNAATSRKTSSQSESQSVEQHQQHPLSSQQRHHSASVSNLAQSSAASRLSMRPVHSGGGKTGAARLLANPSLRQKRNYSSSISNLIFINSNNASSQSKAVASTTTTAAATSAPVVEPETDWPPTPTQQPSSSPQKRREAGHDGVTTTAWDQQLLTDPTHTSPAAAAAESSVSDDTDDDDDDDEDDDDSEDEWRDNLRVKLRVKINPLTDATTAVAGVASCSSGIDNDPVVTAGALKLIADANHSPSGAAAIDGKSLSSDGDRCSLLSGRSNDGGDCGAGGVKMSPLAAAAATTLLPPPPQPLGLQSATFDGACHRTDSIRSLARPRSRASRAQLTEVPFHQGLSLFDAEGQAAASPPALPPRQQPTSTTMFHSPVRDHNDDDGDDSGSDVDATSSSSGNTAATSDDRFFDCNGAPSDELQQQKHPSSFSSPVSVVAPYDEPEVIPIAVAIQEVCHAMLAAAPSSRTRATTHPDGQSSRHQVRLIGDIMISLPVTAIARIRRHYGGNVEAGEGDGSVGNCQTSSSSPPPLTLALSGTNQLESIVANKALLTRKEKSNDCDAFTFDMGALLATLEEQHRRHPDAIYFNVDVVKYQLKNMGASCSDYDELESSGHCGEDVDSGGGGSLNGYHVQCPLQMTAYWRAAPTPDGAGPKATHTDLRLDFAANRRAVGCRQQQHHHHSSVGESGPEQPQLVLRDITFAAAVAGDVVEMQSQPVGQWMSRARRAVWVMDQLALSPSLSLSSPPSSPSPPAVSGRGCIRARFRTRQSLPPIPPPGGSGKSPVAAARSPSAFGPVAVQFACEGATLSNIDVAVDDENSVSSNATAAVVYKLSLVKRRFISGKYICQPTVP